MVGQSTVVIALSGRQSSEQTLRWGLREAARRHAPVVLVRTYQEAWEYQWAWYAAPRESSLEVEAKEYLAHALDRACLAYPGLRITSELLHGAPVPALTSATAGAGLVVLGAGGDSDGSRLGAVAGHLLERLPGQVAIVRGESDDEQEAPAVVVGVDGSRLALRAAHVAALAARRRHARLDVVHARRPVAGLPGQLVPGPHGADPVDPGDAADRAVAEAADRLRAAYPDLTVRLRRYAAEPADALVAAADRAQVLVVGSHGLGAFTGLLLGSVSSEVARTAPCPLIVVHDEAPAADDHGGTP